MKNTLYAVVAACLAMLSTSGIVALATAAPGPVPAAIETPTHAERELVAHLDLVIEAQLGRIKHQIQQAPSPLRSVHQ